jgi:hypothetical protein
MLANVVVGVEKREINRMVTDFLILMFVCILHVILLVKKVSGEVSERELGA